MSAVKLMISLQSQGVRFDVDGDQLTVEAPKGSLSRDTLERIREHKQALIDILNDRQAVPQTISEVPEATAPTPPESIPPVPAYIARCTSCGGSDWGPVGSDEHGEIWGCLTCHFATVPSCPDCHGINIVKDAVGAYCVDCKRRPGDAPAEPEPEPRPVHVGVTWGDGKGWLKLTDPVTGETCEIRVKGIDKRDRWVFDRLERRPKRASEGFIENPDKIKDLIFDDYKFIGEVKMRDSPIMSGKKWPVQNDESPAHPLPELPPVHQQAACPNCKGRRVKHLVTDTMCLACGHRFETDYQPPK
jgi:hypothetical protein